MSDLTRRPGDTPPVESTRDPGADTRRTASGADGPPAAAQPESTRTAPDTGPGADSPSVAGTVTGHGAGGEHRVLPPDDTDKLAAQLQHAVAGFVDAPRDAVQEADHVLRELTERFTEAVTERRRSLRRSWQTPDTMDPGDGPHVAATDTEQLRLALRDYRQLAERLLGV
ncbi:hypothetical protein AB0L56_16560 [Streptomyces sp. NPDC052079]|uniref:hypothetical protein n=1 Tax=Streptomyces sp. NPDC052079 TaxID=3155526 RepID=UPI0034167A03